MHKLDCVYDMHVYLYMNFVLVAPACSPCSLFFMNMPLSIDYLLSNLQFIFLLSSLEVKHVMGFSFFTQDKNFFSLVNEQLEVERAKR
jgi:hypothetical protein